MRRKCLAKRMRMQSEWGRVGRVDNGWLHPLDCCKSVRAVQLFVGVLLRRVLCAS